MKLHEQGRIYHCGHLGDKLPSLKLFVLVVAQKKTEECLEQECDDVQKLGCCYLGQWAVQKGLQMQAKEQCRLPIPEGTRSPEGNPAQSILLKSFYTLDIGLFSTCLS